jgi:hypothetical protein
LEPKSSESRSFSDRLYFTERAPWKLTWFLTDFGYDTESLNRDQVNRVRIRSPRTNLQIKILRTLPGGSEFVSYLDAVGEVAAIRRLIGGAFCLYSPGASPLQSFLIHGPSTI